MKKYLVILLFALTIGGYFLYPYLEQMWAMYQLQAIGINLLPPGLGNADTIQKIKEREFVSAACRRDPKVLPLLLKTQISVNSKGDHGITALHCAAADGNLQAIRLLLDHGANISAHTDNTIDNGDLAPIHFAAAWHHMDIVELLKSRGANINEPSQVGTPLTIALTVLRLDRFALYADTQRHSSDLLEIYQAMLKMGADPSVVDAEGNTLLHVTMFSHQRALIEAMLASGKFDLNQPNNAGDTPFMNYVRSAPFVRAADGRTGVTTDLDFMAQMISKGANVNARNKKGRAVILDTVTREDQFKLLMQNGADVFVADDNGYSIWTELQYLPPYIVMGFADKLAVLRTPKMADGKPGDGPLHVFARHSQNQLVDYFLKRGLLANERNFELNTPLHLTLKTPRFIPGHSTNDISVNQELCIKMLLDAGADPNARNQYDETPLMLASRYPVLIVRMLLAKKADVNAVARYAGANKHVLDYFTEQRNLEGIRELVKAGASKSK